jgi:hypothetical protein
MAQAPPWTMRTGLRDGDGVKAGSLQEGQTEKQGQLQKQVLHFVQDDNKKAKASATCEATVKTTTGGDLFVPT